MGTGKWLAIALAALGIAGCANVSCRREFVINMWQPPEGLPHQEFRLFTSGRMFSEIESVSFLTCSYDD